MTDDLNRLRAVTDEERYELGHPSPLGELVRQHQEKRSPARGVEACVCGRSVVGVPGWYLAHFASEMRAMVEANVAARTAALLERTERAETERDAQAGELEFLRERKAKYMAGLGERFASELAALNDLAALRAAVTAKADRWEAEDWQALDPQMRVMWPADELRSLLAAAPTETEGTPDE